MNLDAKKSEPFLGSGSNNDAKIKPFWWNFIQTYNWCTTIIRSQIGNSTNAGGCWRWRMKKMQVDGEDGGGDAFRGEEWGL